MKTKICTKCGIEKELSEFYKDKSKPDGHRPNCKECIKIYKKNYRDKNKENIKKSNHKYYINNKKKIQKIQKIYNDKNKKTINKYKQEWGRDNRKQINEYIKNKRKIDIRFKIACNLRY